MKEYEEAIIWWRLAIESVVSVSRYDMEEMTAQRVAGEVYTRYYFLGIPPFEELLEACDTYLQSLGDPFTSPDRTIIDLNGLPKTTKSNFRRTVDAKRHLMGTYMIKLNTFSKNVLDEPDFP